jgi:hypothetical protein
VNAKGAINRGHRDLFEEGCHCEQLGSCCREMDRS